MSNTFRYSLEEVEFNQYKLSNCTSVFHDFIQNEEKREHTCKYCQGNVSRSAAYYYRQGVEAALRYVERCAEREDWQRAGGATPETLARIRREAGQ